LQPVRFAFSLAEKRLCRTKYGDETLFDDSASFSAQTEKAKM
jgi:hypothetical protein